jgi:hypothetical protein
VTQLVAGTAVDEWGRVHNSLSVLHVDSYLGAGFARVRLAAVGMYKLSVGSSIPVKYQFGDILLARVPIHEARNPESVLPRRNGRIHNWTYNRT